MSEPLLNISTSNTPSEKDGTTQLQVLEGQLAVATAKRNAKGAKATGTKKSEPKTALGKENVKPVKKHRPGKSKAAEKLETVPEVKKEEKDCVRWADPTQAHLTDTLLTKIEDSLRYRKVFGFCVGDVNVSAGDLNTIKVCRLLAPEIFKDSKMSSEKLALSIKARVTSLKNTYQRYRKELGQTGHIRKTAGAFGTSFAVFRKTKRQERQEDGCLLKARSIVFRKKKLTFEDTDLLLKH